MTVRTFAISSREKNIWSLVRNRVVVGLFVVIPIGVTLWLGFFIYTTLTTWSISFLEQIAPDYLRDLFWLRQLVRLGALLLIFLGLFLVGALTRYALGRKLISFAEWLLLKLPMLNMVYSTTREIGEALWTPRRGVFRKVVLFEYPRRGLYSVGFLTNENDDGDWEPEAKTGRRLVSVFLPTTPNPTSGFLMLVPREDCVYLNMDISTAMRLVISGGVVKPGMKMNYNLNDILADLQESAASEIILDP